MKRIQAFMLPLLSVLVVYLAIRFVLIPMVSPVPDHLGTQADGRLASCPHNSNCVSSYARMTDLAHYVVPLRFTGRAEEARQQVADLLAKSMLVSILASRDNYIHAEYRTSVLGFIDDMELHFDEASGIIHVRSASRLGGNDFGGNRQRVEDLRQELATILGWNQR